MLGEALDAWNRVGEPSLDLIDVKGLQATDRGPEMVERGLMLATALAPAIGYDAAAAIAKEAAKSGRSIREVAHEKTQLSEEELNTLLDPEKMTEPGLGGGPASG